MCFVLYSGTSRPIPRREWHADAPDLCVESLTERDNPVAKHFSKPEVQYIGSTSGCGCDFPHVISQNGGWPWWEDDETEPEHEARDRYNRQHLVTLLRESGESSIELYGIWDDGLDYTASPAIREEISVENILDRDFRFKERGFYVVRCALPSSDVEHG